MVTVQNFTLEQGATFTRNIALSDSSGNPLNPAGYTAYASIKHEPDSSNTYPFEVNLTTGNLALRMEANTTSQLHQGKWVYDVIITNGTDVIRVSEGIVSVDPAVTTIG